jgi:hypothetical protein
VGYELLHLLSYIFGESLNKRNLKQFLEKQNNLNIKSFNNFGNMTNCLNYYGNRPSPSPNIEPETPEYQRAKYLVKIETANKLRKRGLSDAEIAEILDIAEEDLKEY